MAAPPRSADARLAALGTVAAAVAVTSWGVGPVIVKDIELGGLAVAFYRLLFGALLAVIVLYGTGRRLTWRTLVAAVPGGMAFGLDILLFFSSVKWTTVADATVISALQPALVLLVVGRLFGERVRPPDVAWTGVAIVGVGVVVFASGTVHGRSLSGDVLATLALGAWAWYFVAVKQARRHVAALEYQTALAIVAAVLVCPIAAASGQSLHVPDARTWGLLAITIVMGGTGHFIMNWANAYTPLMLTSLLTLASPVVSVAAAAVILGEPVLAGHVIGMAIVIGSLGIVVARTTAHARAAPEAS